MQLNSVSDILKLYPVVPSFQRLIDKTRVNELFESILADCKTTPTIQLPGCVIIAKTKDRYWILDGMHRLEAYKRLFIEHQIDLKCYTHILTVATEEEAIKLFNKINNTRMLPSMPDGVDIDVVKTVVDHLQTKYPKIFSNSKTGKCMRPHIHFNRVQEELAKSLRKYPVFNNHNDLVGRIEELNIKITTDEILTQKFEFSKFLDSAKSKGGFYLGIIPNYAWIELVFSEELKPSKKKPIPVAVRNKVWVCANGKSWTGYCFTCGCEIDITNFHCGHDLAESKGGTSTVDNLKPICMTCNLSMGTKSFAEMKKMLST